MCLSLPVSQQSLVELESCNTLTKRRSSFIGGWFALVSTNIRMDLVLPFWAMDTCPWPFRAPTRPGGWVSLVLDVQDKKIEMGMGVCEIPPGIEFLGALEPPPATLRSVTGESRQRQLTCQD